MNLAFKHTYQYVISAAIGVSLSKQKKKAFEKCCVGRAALHVRVCSGRENRLQGRVSGVTMSDTRFCFDSELLQKSGELRYTCLTLGLKTTQFKLFFFFFFLYCKMYFCLSV